MAQRNKINNLTAEAVTFGDKSPAQAGGATTSAPSRSPKGRGTGRVFVIHGRDIEARDAVFDFLRALGLTPLEWERMVRATGSTVPSLKEVITEAVRGADAVVALLTPDDIVELHPSLREAADGADERGSCQSRPNVLLELGMALALHPDSTIILELGAMRRPADLGGLNYIDVDLSGKWLNKVANRLEGAGCPVDRTGDHGRHAARVGRLAAHERRPH